MRTTDSLQKIELLSCGSLTDESLEPLKHQTSLRELTLKGALQISHETVLKLRGLEHLQVLSLSGASALQCAPLSGFKSLTDLHLADCASLVKINFPNRLPLVVLDVRGCPRLTDEGLATVAKLKLLADVYLSGTGITDETILLLPSSSIRVRTVISVRDSRNIKGFLTQDALYLITVCESLNFPKYKVYIRDTLLLSCLHRSMCLRT